MTKDEALKLALEALEKIFRTQYHIETPPIESLEEKMRRIAYKAIADIKEALAQPEPDMLTIAYQSGYYDGKKAALAGREWNFCERCGKRTKDLTVIHTCTPPQGAA